MILVVLFPGSLLRSQSDTTSSYLDELPAIQISAYSKRSDLVRLPAAFQIIQDTFRLDHSFSFASSFNQAPGVRLEERSPGSYRLSIRGSTLRSPFGVRNVKVYLDGYSLSDGGGNTYLQLINPELIQKIEVLKGPAASLYGAGTGGAVLFSSRRSVNQIQLGVGSYGRWQESIQLIKNYKKWKFQFFQSHQSGKNYREQSKLRRDMMHMTQHYQSKKSSVHFFQWYGDLKYETPGGLTADQLSKNPRQARPAAGRLPGAVEQQAGIYNKTLMIGSGYEYDFSSRWSMDIKLHGWYTDFKNPFITNFETRFENNISIRPELKYFKSLSQGNLEWTSGLEYLDQKSIIKNFGNNKGSRDTLQNASQINSNQTNGYTQVQWNHRRWQVLTGMSLNQQVFNYKSRSDQKFVRKESGPVVMPRFSVSYSIHPDQSVFLSAARGYSPPTVTEIRPSSGEYNHELLPENGWNMEVGYKSFTQPLDFSINLYALQLQDAIVRRNDAAGVEYFVNSGGARMNGVESWAKYKSKRFHISAAIAWQPYTFQNYKQRVIDFSGLPVTGVPEFTLSSQLDYTLAQFIHLGVGWYHQTDLPLNDANTVLLPKYDLLTAFLRLDIRKGLYMTLSVDNLLNASYSPGPDINAAANRYFNPGAPRSLMVGVRYTW